MNDNKNNNDNNKIEFQNTDVSISNWKTILAILSCLGLIVMFDETMILPAIPDFIKEFDISYSTSTWILSSYIIAGAVMTPIAGKLSDIYGKKKMLLIVMAIYSIGILSGRFSTNIDFMIISRVAQGIGMAMFPIAFGIIRDVLPEKKLSIGQTIFGSTFSGGAVLGIVVGATIIQNFGWQTTFFSIFPAAVALWFIIWKSIQLTNNRKIQPTLIKNANNENYSHNKNSVKNKNKDKFKNTNSISIRKESNIKKIDLKGTLVLAIAVVSFLAGISMLETNDPNTVYKIISLFLVTAISIGVFIIIEKKTELPLLDLKLMTNRIFITPIIILMFVSMSIFMVYQTIPVMVRSPVPLGFGGDAMASANIQLPFMIVLFIGTIISGFLLNKIGNIKLLVFGTIISTIGFFFLLISHSSEIMVSLGLAIISCGLSLSIAGVFNVILLSVPMNVTGIALGMTLLLNLIGMSIGPALAGVFQQMNQGNVPGISGLFPTSNAYNMIFAAALVMSSISVILTIIISMKKNKISNTIPAMDEDKNTK